MKPALSRTLAVVTALSMPALASGCGGTALAESEPAATDVAVRIVVTDAGATNGARQDGDQCVMLTDQKPFTVAVQGQFGMTVTDATLPTRGDYDAEASGCVFSTYVHVHDADRFGATVTDSFGDTHEGAPSAADPHTVLVQF